MEYRIIKDLCSIKTGKLDANASVENGKYPFFTCAKEPSRIDTFAYDCSCVLLAGNGEFNVNMYSGKFNAYQRTYIIEPVNSNETSLKLLYYIVKNSIEHFKNISNGGIIKFIKLGDVQNIKFPDLSFDKQQEIVSILDKINAIIDADKKHLELLDETVKSRFIEMFGDVKKNNMEWNTVPFKALCNEIGDGLHGTPKYDDNGDYYFINGNNLENKSICIKEDTKKVSEDEYRKHYIELDNNTVLISINGTFGKTGFYNNERIILGKSACYIKLKECLNKEFVINMFGTDAWMEYMEENSSGTTIKNFGLKAMREFKMIVPPIELQNEFAVFVELIDKSKFNVQQHLNLMQELLDKKMDEYFGGEC